MQEGFQADDIWRMVEDEFYSTAQSFTQHIHRAEYVRLKNLAKSRGAGTLRSIARATDGKTKQGEELVLKLEAEELAKKRRAAARADGDEGSSSGEGDDYMQDAQLAGLMMGEARSGKDLTTVVKAQPKTRAAAGFSQSPKSTERTQNVLSAAAPYSKMPLNTEVKAEMKQTDGRGYPSKGSGSATIFKQFARKPVNLDQSGPAADTLGQRHTSSNKTSPKSPTKMTESTLHGPAETTTTKESAREYLAKKRAEKERKEQEAKRKAKMADSIPTFLF